MRQRSAIQQSMRFADDSRETIQWHVWGTDYEAPLQAVLDELKEAIAACDGSWIDECHAAFAVDRAVRAAIHAAAPASFPRRRDGELTSESWHRIERLRSQHVCPDWLIADLNKRLLALGTLQPGSRPLHTNALGIWPLVAAAAHRPEEPAYDC